MPPRRGHADHNHNAIAYELRQVGACVLDVHGSAGCMDLLVGFRGVWRLLEVKNLGGRGLRFTPAEQETIRLAEAAGCTVHVVTSGDEALRVIGAIK